VCTGYRERGGAECPAPFGSDAYERIEPIYEELPGWQDSTAGARSVEELPPNARAYLRCIEETVEAPIDIISTGPDRSETIVLRNPFD
jgi:adenylosuccinate synthase